MTSIYVFKLSNMQGQYLAGAVDLRTIYGASLAHHKTGFRLLFRKRVFWNSQRQGIGSLLEFQQQLRRLESKIQLDMNRRHAAAEDYARTVRQKMRDKAKELGLPENIMLTDAQMQERVDAVTIKASDITPTKSIAIKHQAIGRITRKEGGAWVDEAGTITNETVERLDKARRQRDCVHNYVYGDGIATCTKCGYTE